MSNLTLEATVVGRHCLEQRKRAIKMRWTFSWPVKVPMLPLMIMTDKPSLDHASPAGHEDVKALLLSQMNAAKHNQEQ
jgi:hypothetical protein